MNLNSFEELKLSGNLPSPPGVGMKILQLTRTDDFSAEEMGEAIMTDSALTGRILRLANAAVNAGAEPVTTVSDSIMRLGSRTVRDLSLAFSLVSSRRSGACRVFDYERYWSRSLARAVCAQTLSRVAGYGKPEEAYICGLLGEIGMLALASVYAEEYGALIEASVPGNEETLLKAEGEAFGIDHSQVGECILEDWGLPARFAHAIATFTRSRGMREGETEITDLANLLRYANVVAEAMVAGEGTSGEAWRRLGDDLDRMRNVVGMQEAAFVEFCDTCVKEWVAWGESLEVTTGGDVTFEHIFERIAAAREAGAAGDSAEEATPSVEAQSAARADLVDRIRILAVDDDPVSLRVLTKHLERSGYDVETAAGGKEGLKLALKNTPDIVIADWEMPGFSGLEMCSSLRKTDTGRGMYFLLLTGRDEESLVVEAFDCGVDDFVTKPFVPKILNARIKGGIRLARLQRKVEADKQTMMRQVAELSMLTRKLRTASLTDTLTELPNRRYAFKRLENEWSSARRTTRPFCLMMVDIDLFKRFNDDHGHDVGDAVLRETAMRIQSALRNGDEVCRVGGEEFLVICQNADETIGSRIGERIRRSVEGAIAVSGLELEVTISVGVASYSPGQANVEELLKDADLAVYESKRNGRNRVSVASAARGERRSA